MDRYKATTQLLGRFQPWHDGHTELFKRALAKTGQVIILLREMDLEEKNPLSIEERTARIQKSLYLAGYEYGREYEIQSVPNITHITYGRDVGYKIEEEVLDEATQAISATAIREQWKQAT